MIHLGFTGSRTGITEEQGEELNNIFSEHNKFVLHHGQCIGADLFTFLIAKPYNNLIVFHPPIYERNMFILTDDFKKDLKYKIEKPKDYLVRNKDIVDQSKILIACPETAYEKSRSGTWSTINYAKRKKRKILIIFPSGNINTIN